MRTALANFGTPFIRSHRVSIPDGSSGIWQSVKAIQRLPSEPIGFTTVTFDGVVAGSEIRVYLRDGLDLTANTELAGLDSCVANQELTWPVYPNLLATVIITIVKRGLKIQRFSYLSKTGLQELKLIPQIDLGYNNPA